MDIPRALFAAGGLDNFGTSISAVLCQSSMCIARILSFEKASLQIGQVIVPGSWTFFTLGFSLREIGVITLPDFLSCSATALVHSSSLRFCNTSCSFLFFASI